ncbi:MAG: hypothetical protein V4760_01965 [Bdellovibrionota bacterium]
MKLNQRGQLTIEAILLMAAMVSMALFLGREIRDRKMVAGLVEGPWQPIQGMIEDGVWTNPKDSKARHPSIKARHATARGNTVPGS